jgi:hypothetical protein
MRSQPASPFCRVVADLFSLTGSDFSFDDVKRRCLELGWTISEESPENAVLRVLLDDALSVLIAALDRRQEFGPILYLPLFYSDDPYDAILAREAHERLGFDAAFAVASETATSCLGAPTAAGRWGYPGRSQDYSYSAWRGQRGVLFLVQDDFDIIFGSEISVWLAPREPQEPIPELPLHS